MKQSTINRAMADASMVFTRHGWALPPNPRWDVTGFGLEDFERYGLTVINLCELPEYCEKLMFERCMQETPIHKHNVKQEDIICRTGVLAIQLFAQDEAGRCRREGGTVEVLLNGERQAVPTGTTLHLQAGERVTLYPCSYHRFYPVSEYAIIGEVSTRNDDHGDNIWDNPRVKRFDVIEADATPLARVIQ